MQFKISDAIEMANWSLLAYGQTPIPINTQFEWIEKTTPWDIHCLVIYQSDKTIFAFRGTNNFADWLVDSNVVLKTIANNIQVHRGFYNSVSLIWPRLSEIAEKSKTPIYVTGHSKGGAENRQFVYRMATEKKIFATLSMSFGEPRSFGRKGANTYNELDILTYRLIDSSDVVPRIPWLCGRYKHVHNEIFIDEWNNLLWNEPWYAHIPSDLTDMIKELFRRKNALIADHSIQLYINKLKAIQSNFN